MFTKIKNRLNNPTPLTIFYVICVGWILFTGGSLMAIFAKAMHVSFSKINLFDPYTGITMAIMGLCVMWHGFKLNLYVNRSKPKN